MRLLVVSPDYASHVEPMLQVALEWQRSVGPATVATGEAVRRSVDDSGLDWTPLRLGRGSNAGIIRTHEQPPGEDDHLDRFFAATREGAVATLTYQAKARRHDLLFEPERVLEDLRRIIDDVQPDRVLVDHVAFGARLALHALGIDAASIVLGHPTALPAPGEVYGLPLVWPSGLAPSDRELAELHEICAESTRDLTDASNELIGRVAPSRPRIENLTRLAGNPTIYMYPDELHDPGRPLPDGSVSIGSLRRDEDSRLLADDLPAGTGALVLVALGTFLSARGDVLATAVEAARDRWRLALATGSTRIETLGPLPPGALVRHHLPQVALLRHANVLITHGGNNSVTEACAAGVPMVVLPMSTDQFAGAAAIERAGIGVALDPNALDAEMLRSAVDDLLASGATERVQAIARSISEHGGPAVAVEAIRAAC
jgi:zeaxanthin glucosyltransferase